MDSVDFRSRLGRFVREAGDRALERGQHVLVSVSERIASRDPLAVLEAIRRSAGSDPRLAATLAAGCAYWTRPAGNFAIAAFGAAATFSPSGEERFAVVDREWGSLLQNAVIDCPASTPAVGPILIGGFSFDPGGPLTQRWQNFPSSHVILPLAHVTSLNAECWLTTSAVVEQGRDGSAHVEELHALREWILDATPSEESSADDVTSDVQVVADQAEDEWCTIVEHAVDAIHFGSLRKVVLARSASGTADSDIDAVKLLRNLRSVHRDAFVFGYWRGSDAFAGASPERLVHLEGRRITASSLAGTIRRGATPRHDGMLARQLQASEKDLAEHAAVREMLHEVLAEFDPNVTSSDTPALVTLSNLHHLHTEVRAELDDRHSILDVVERLHPTPAVGGAPRSEALDFIRDNENLDRGWYAAPIGWMDRIGGEFAVALRSGIIRGREFALFAGCGIVADSDPELELAESTLKLQPMRSAIAASLVTAEDTEMALASQDTE